MANSPFEEELRATLGGVKPLPQGDKIVVGKSPADEAAARARREAAAAEAEGENLTDYLSDERVELVDGAADELAAFWQRHAGLLVANGADRLKALLLGWGERSESFFC